MSTAIYTFLVDWDDRFTEEAQKKASLKTFYEWLEMYGDENNWSNPLSLYYPGSDNTAAQCINLYDGLPMDGVCSFTEELKRSMNVGLAHAVWKQLYFVSQCVAYDVCPRGHEAYVEGSDSDKPNNPEDWRKYFETVQEYMNTDFSYALGLAYLEKSDYLSAASVGVAEGTWHLHKFRAAQMYEAYCSADVPFFSLPGYGGPYDWRAFDLCSEKDNEAEEKTLDILPPATALLFVRIHT